MTWQSDIEALLDHLPGRFRLADIYRFVPLLHEKHPENRHIEEKIRQTLQVLRDAGQLRFVDGGLYEQVGHEEETVVATLPIKIGELTTRARLSEMLGQAGDAPLRRGMFKPARGPYSNHMFLFHNERDNPYGDAHDGDVIQYVGQGMGGDQEMRGFNLTLAQHLDRGVQVHYFVQPKDAPGQVRYVGPVVVDSYDQVFRASEGRSVWVFTLIPAKHDGQPEDAVREYSQAYASVLEYTLPAGPVERRLVVSMVNKRIRDRAFAGVVLRAYRTLCAVCGEPLRKGRVSELEAAHIRPVDQQGPDDPRNGMSLCRRHHWAFDHGFFTISDKETVTWLAPSPDPHSEVVGGANLELPTELAFRPHSEYVGWHRTEWSGVARALEFS